MQCILRLQFSSSPMSVTGWKVLVSSLTVIVIVSLFTSNQFQAKYYDIDLYCFFFPFFLGIKDKKFPLSGFINLDTSSNFWMMMVKSYLRLCVSAKFNINLIRHCNSDLVMGNTFFIIFFYFTKISINDPTQISKIPSKR